MKLKKAREIVEKKLIIYPNNVDEIERKQANKNRNPDIANRFRDNAAEFQAIYIRDEFLELQKKQ